MQELATFIKFCEPTYQRVSFVAEFWNTMSSFAYCVPAIHFWILTERFGRSIPECFTSTTVWRYKLCAACWFILGLGSAAFHSFQTIWAEMWDEIGMLVAILSLSFCLFDLHPLTTSKRASWFYGILILSVFAALLVYIQIMHHPFFVATFLLAAHVPLLLAMTMPINMNRLCVKLFKEKLRGPTRASRAAEDSAKKISRSLSLFGSLSSNRGVFIGILLSVIGYAIWHIDQKCVSDNWKPIYSLPYEYSWFYWTHPFWHVATAIGSLFIFDATLKVRVDVFHSRLLRRPETGSFVPIYSLSDSVKAIMGSEIKKSS